MIVPRRAVAFDLFHTLVDPEEFRPREFTRAGKVAELLGLPRPEFEAYWTADLPHRAVEARPTVLERVRAYCRRVGVAAPAAVWAEVDDCLGRYADRALAAPRPAVLATLDELRRRGWSLGVLSNCDEREVRSWPRSPLAPKVDAAIFSWSLGAAKPARAAYDALVPRWGGTPLADAVFVGDGHSDELPGARAAGFGRVIFQRQFVGTNGLRSPEQLEKFAGQADATIDDLRELLELVGRPSSGP